LLGVPRRQLQQAQRALGELAGALGQAPDPLPYLHAVAGLQGALAEAQRQNRKLAAHSRAADSEASSASSAVLRCRELERELGELRREAAAQVALHTAWLSVQRELSRAAAEQILRASTGNGQLDTAFLCLFLGLSGGTQG
jgi:hypothetical protein